MNASSRRLARRPALPSLKGRPAWLLACAIAAGSLTARATEVVEWLFHDSQLTVPAGLNQVKAIAAGGEYSLAMKRSGTVVAWGLDASVPAGLGKVKAIAAGYGHSLALKHDGTVVAWMKDGSGQAVPPGLGKVQAIAAGMTHNLALRHDGTVVAWGDNGSGQTNVPAGLGQVKAIAAGDNHSLALKSNGTVVAWGWNFYGQTNVPPGLSQVKAIAAGAEHSLALKSDGTVVTWGWGSGGQGTGPAGLRQVQSIAAGEVHCLALRDTTRPAIKITGPKKSGSYPSSRKIQIRGKATDNLELVRWQYRLNGGKWKNGGTLSGDSATWKKRIGRVKADRNTVQVRAYDGVGSVSKVQKRTVRLSR